MLRFNSRAAVAVIAAFAAAACLAQADKPVPLTGEALAIKKSLEQKFPGAEIRSVLKTQYLGGLYEVQLDDRIVYTDAKAKHIVVGALYDTDLCAWAAHRALHRVRWLWRLHAVHHALPRLCTNTSARPFQSPKTRFGA